MLSLPGVAARHCNPATDTVADGMARPLWRDVQIKI